MSHESRGSFFNSLFQMFVTFLLLFEFPFEKLCLKDDNVASSVFSSSFSTCIGLKTLTSLRPVEEGPMFFGRSLNRKVCFADLLWCRAPDS